MIHDTTGGLSADWTAFCHQLKLAKTDSVIYHNY